VHDQILNVGESLPALVSVKDINGRAVSNALVVSRMNKTGVVTVTGIDATGTSGTDAFTITGVGSGIVELWFELNSRRSRTYQIKVR
jgi:hypothetical protein